MKSIILSLATIGVLAVSPAAVAQSSRVVTQERTTLFAGPDYDYPRVATVQRWQPVRIYGCLYGRDWCDVSVNGYRGWIDSDDLAYGRGGRYGYTNLRYNNGWNYPIISFSFGPYWDNHYRRQPWYAERARYQYHHNNRPEYRPPNHGPNRPYPYNNPNNRPNQWNDRNDNRYNNPRYDRNNSNDHRRDEWRDGQRDGRNDRDNRITDHRNNRDDKHN